LLVREGWQVSRKFVQKVRRAEGLMVRPPKKKQRRLGQSGWDPMNWPISDEMISILEGKIIHEEKTSYRRTNSPYSPRSR